MPELYHHQVDGADWLSDRPRAMLFDEQGLGKTITAIEAANTVSVQGDRVLVVCPSVVVWNWARELVTWSTFLGADDIQVVETTTAVVRPTARAVIVTHGLILAPMIRAQLAETFWRVTVLDEAHCFRNPDAQRTRVFYGDLVPVSDYVWILTGTPMPNNASELWPHLRGLFPDVMEQFTGFHHFRATFCRLRQTPWGVKVTGNKSPEVLRRLFGPLFLRRLKRDVLPDLPPIRFEVVTVAPTVPAWELEQVESMVAPAVWDTIREGATPDDLVGGLQSLRDVSEFARWRALCGAVKVQPAIDLLTMELETGALDKVAVFAHHTAVVHLLVDALMDFSSIGITGATSVRERQAAIDKFQTDPQCRVIVCNIIAGGTGATLTAASDAVFVELSFVPGENAQAADRIHRIGQANAARVRFLALAGSVDEDITATLRTKTKMIREILE